MAKNKDIQEILTWIKTVHPVIQASRVFLEQQTTSNRRALRLALEKLDEQNRSFTHGKR